MRNSSDSRFPLKRRVLSAFSWLAALLAAVTGLWPDWIELVWHTDPDHHSGSTEWGLVIALMLAAVLLAALALRERCGRVKAIVL